MKKSIDDLELIKPASLDDRKQIKAWFSLKNSDFRIDGAVIRGLNLGFNTSEKKKIVAQNRTRWLEALDLDPAWIAYADQVHSTRVQRVSQGGTYPETDALVTRIPGLALAIQVADCAAVLLWDSVNSVIAAVHAGWRGAAGDIIPLTVEKMTGAGAEASQTRAYISPCISLEHFEVGLEVSEQFPDVFVDDTGYQKPHVDLKGFLKSQLQETGIKSEHIETDKGCTVSSNEKFYSYRREGRNSGRMMAVIQMKSNVEK